ncbi:MAG TPA: hypothetical protein VK327_08860 [Candidatus Paceibacterota bacterium]|nr:hypothetical protein [Candidatus Paceibacterota bacterium]
MIAITTAVSSVVIAAITTYGTIAASGEKISGIRQKAEDVGKEVQSLSEIEKIANVPIGTIVASMLPPQQFAQIVGDPFPPNQERSKWVLADGNGIAASLYGKVSREQNAPDLRGMFLRGMNEGRTNGDPESGRKAGGYQSDAFENHGHTTTATEKRWSDAPAPGYTSDSRAKNAPAGQVTDVIGGKTNIETRPKNVAVYYYIKIN